MHQWEQGRSHSGTKQIKSLQGPLREVFQHRHHKNCHALARASGPHSPVNYFNVWPLQNDTGRAQKNPCQKQLLAKSAPRKIFFLSHFARSWFMTQHTQISLSPS